jgi:PAS domain S-box-containing protein
MGTNIRSSGIDIIGDVPWGTHICQFYDTKEDLTDILVPYFKAGLENNEFCLWVTSGPLEVEEAKNAFERAVPDIDVYLKKGQIEIISYKDWYLKEDVFDSKRVISGWVEKLNQALANGYDGLRMTENTFWLQRESWNDFIDYEKEADRIIGNYRMIGICNYSFNRRNSAELVDVVTIHKFFLIKNKGKWEGVDNFGRRRGQEALQKSEGHFHKVFTQPAVGLFIISPTIGCQEVNDRFCEITGYNREELVSKHWRQLVHPEDQEEVASALDNLLNGETTSFVKDLRCIRADGRIIWARLDVSLFYNNENGIDGQPKLIGVIEDIANRKKEEEVLKKVHAHLDEKVKKRAAELEGAYNSLKESEQSLTEAQKMAQIGNWKWDKVTGEIHWSSELFRIFGLTPQKIGLPFNEVLNYTHPDDRDYVGNAIKRAFSGEPFDIEFKIVLANGEERTVHAQTEVVFNEENISVQMKGIVQDITERKKAEEKIQILANVVESSNDAILTKSLDGNIISWNKGAEKIYGYSAEEILGKNMSIFEPENLKAELKQLSEKIKKGGSIQNFETSRLKKDGTIVNVSATVSPVFDSHGKLVAVSAISRDITERIKAEKLLAEAEDARKKEIHHRIKNNLQVISSLLDLQAEKFSHREAVFTQEILEAFRESQNRVLSMSLIHEELYKGEGTDTLDFSTYIQKLAENLFQTYSFSSKNVHLYMNLEENAFFNMDTAVPLGTIVNELVSNSLKHAFQGKNRGEIRIKLYKEKTGKCGNGKTISKSEDFKNTSFTLTVSDNGVGIPENLNIEALDSLGFQLVTTLVDQLEGELELKRNNGTECAIRFAITEKE